MALDPQAHHGSRGCHQAQEGLAARSPIQEQQLITAYLFEGGSRQGADTEAALGKTLRELGARCRCHDDLLPLLAPKRGPGGAAIVAVHGQVVRDQES
jgi:hypothetical protein